MTKNIILLAALASLALLMSCSSAHTPAAPVDISVKLPGGISTLYVGQVVQITATVKNTLNTGVTWTLTQNGTACTDPNVCGTLSSTTANPVTYTAPTQPETVTITATSQADGTAGSLDLSIVNISVQVTPYASNIGVGLTQQFTAVVVPDDAPQTVTWSLTNCAGGPCGSIDANSGVYSAAGANAGATFNVQAAAVSPLSGNGAVPATVVASRLTPNETYAFRFSGFNSSTKLAFASAGILTVGGNGKTITGGTWDELTSGGPLPCTFTGGSFTANTNNQGTLNLTGNCNGSARSPQYNVVFDAAGNIQMIDSTGTGSGVMRPVTGSFGSLASLKGNFVFGVSGVDTTTNGRTGYVGLLPMDGAGAIGGGGTPGLMDINHGGSAGSGGDITGTYSVKSGGVFAVQITSNTLGKTFKFDLYGVSGQLKASDPAVLYAISTDSGNPGVVGTVKFQDSKLDTSPAGLNANSVVDLTGVNTSGGSNVSLSLVSPDRKGNISVSFDQNNAGSAQHASFTNTYAAPGRGRYTINLLGGSGKSTPFVLYLSTANSGFILDQASSSVMTGSMTPQLPKGHSYSSSELPSTYSLATTSSGDKSVDPVDGNALLTWVNTGNCTATCSSGTFFDANHAGGLGVAGTYTVAVNGAGGLGAGGSSVTLTTPNNQSFVVYMLDVFDSTNPTQDTSHFLMMQVDSGVNNASIINVQQ